MWRVQVWENKKVNEAFLFETEKEALLKKGELERLQSGLVKVEEFDTPSFKETLVLINPFHWFILDSHNRRIHFSRVAKALSFVFAFVTIILFSFRSIFTTHSNHILFTILAEISLVATLILGMVGRYLNKENVLDASSISKTFFGIFIACILIYILILWLKTSL